MMAAVSEPLAGSEKNSQNGKIFIDKPNSLW